MRVLLKISGEMLSWEKNFWIEDSFVKYVAHEIKEIIKSWIEVSVVLWAWNIIRWATESWSVWIDRAQADNMWMLAITINSIYLWEVLEGIGIKTKILTAQNIEWIWERFTSKKAREYLKKWYVTIFSWWTWSPYFTTDTAWVLRALETKSDIIIKATKVDWVYDKDPKHHGDAILIHEASYDEIIQKNLRVMDITSIVMAREANLTVKVVNLYKTWAMLKCINWKDVWTTIS
jgi:uridylate kinase